MIVEFKGDTVSNTFIVDQGVINEIVTRGWEYGIMKTAYQIVDVAVLYA